MRLGICVMALVLATGAAAEVPDTKAARKALYSVKGYDIEVSETLSKENAAMVKAIVPLMAEHLRQPVRYYAAIAWSPDDGMVHESLQASVNHHTPESAAAGAIAACAPLRSETARNCEVAALILPKKYKPGGLTLSVDATAAFDKSYRKAKSPKAFAVSRTGGGWGMGTSDAEAIRACAESSGATDCEVAIRN